MFLGRDAVTQGVLTPNQLRGPLVERVLQGVYRPSWTPLTHVLACQAVALVLPDGACVTGRSAATMRGVPLARVTDPVEVCAPEALRMPSRRGVTLRRSKRPIGEVHDVDGVPLANAQRMAFDLAARHPLARAVGHLDAVSRAGLVDPAGLAIWLETRHENDVRAVRDAVALVDPRTESMPESMARVVLRQAGFDVVPQFVIRARGEFVARVDLALPELRIAIEYDGAWHALREQLQRDRRRIHELRRAGWIIVHVTADMLANSALLIHAIEDAVRAATSTIRA
ncbi:endonuclease domain-containing protein [Angustibacter luteus]|uniref:endonuclease domain-containing protein n=1 Tax=Angustibacter luteus TaxID=658456 RepID=UPI002FEA14FA